MSAAKAATAEQAAGASRKTAKPAKSAKVAKSASKSPVSSAHGRERLMTLLLAPHVTEKTSFAQQNSNQYTFKVRRDANRTEVRAAVELMFNVKVAGVQVVNEPGKARRFGRTIGRTQDWKKAYVRLGAGQAIDFESAAKV